MKRRDEKLRSKRAAVNRAQSQRMDAQNKEERKENSMLIAARKCLRRHREFYAELAKW